MNLLRNFVAREDAASAVEYAVLLSLIIVVCFSAITALGDAAYDAIWDVADALDP